MDRQQAIELARKIKQIRRERFTNRSLNYHAILRIKEMPAAKQAEVKERLVMEGYVSSIEELEKMLRRVNSVGTYAVPTESREMSDDILDRNAQYLHINKDLL